jgi:hypothetical protein
MDMEKPTGILTTKYGDTSYRVHSDTLVSLRTDGADNDETQQSLVVRSIPYQVNLELRWNEVDQAWCDDYTYFSRRDNFMKDPSYPARKALTAEVIRAWTEFIEDRPNLLAAGRRADWESDVEMKRHKIEKAREALEALQVELDTLMQEEPMPPLSNITP